MGEINDLDHKTFVVLTVSKGDIIDAHDDGRLNDEEMKALYERVKELDECDMETFAKDLYRLIMDSGTGDVFWENVRWLMEEDE